MGLLQKYRKSLDETWCMKFKTRHPDGDAYDGVIAHLTSEVAGLLRIADFEIDGFQIFPKRSIKGYQDGKFERCLNRIVRFNGQLNSIRIPKWLRKCETLRAVISALMKHDTWPAVEVLINDGKDSALYVGPVVALDDDSFSLRCYDAAGKWEANYSIDYNEVFRLEFGSRYLKHFNNYMKNYRH